MQKLLSIAIVTTAALWAHHGVAALGAFGLEGAGAPLETTSTAALPQNSVLFYSKLDYSSYTLKTATATDLEGLYNTYTMYGLGYGVTPYLSLYAFLPTHTKIDESHTGTSGFADMSVMATLSFTLDGLVKANESLDDMEEWHFALYAGATLPTGNSALTDANGTALDAGSQLGFGEFSYSIGFAATKMLSSDITAIFDANYITFTPHDFAGERVKFGDEIRFNTAATYKLYTNAEAKLRIDGDIEAHYLYLGRDVVDGVGESGTGGHILYTMIATRIYKDNSSIALGVKIPAWTHLNEATTQQGAEGGEAYRAVLTYSSLF
ncbi:MAG: hypothetical protein KU37_10755 [Sulfuricurvum sp. PC08-66]|nr:MAG: hypothetical protein KU37_10755 [Sulfuricurvum sp. PC08-66]